jgi:NADH-quinone oxidoreductase subunit H
MATFLSDYVWPFAIMLAQSVLLLVVLLIVVAYVLLADRKIWPVSVFRRSAQIRS